MSAISPGILAGSFVKVRNNPTTTPAPAVTATHHHWPPNQPGSETSYQLFPVSVTPKNTRPATAPTTPSSSAYPIRIQNPRV